MLSRVNKGVAVARRRRVLHVDNPVAVGARLRGARERAGLSQRQLAFEGCSAAYLSRVEAGDRTPSLQLLRELARRLEVSEEYLAYGTESTASAPNRLFEAELALRMDERETAERLFAEALDEGDEQDRAAAQEGLGQLAFRRGEAQEAIPLLEEAAELWGDQAIERHALNDTLGRCYAYVGDCEASIALFERSLAHVEEQEDIVESARFRVLLSSALSDAGQLARAGEVLGPALAHSEELADPTARIRLYWAQCRLHLLNNRPDLAQRYGRRLIELLELTEDSYRLGRGYGLMASVEVDRGEPASALDLVERASALLQSTGNDVEQAHLRLIEARALAQLGEVERAADLAMQVAGELHERPSEAGQSFTMLAQTLVERGERRRAIEILELAVELLEQAPNRFLVEAYSLLAEALEAEGDRDAAFEILKKGLTARASMERPAEHHQA